MVFNPNNTPTNADEKGPEDLSQVSDEVLMERAAVAKAAREAAQVKVAAAEAAAKPQEDAAIKAARKTLDEQFADMSDNQTRRIDARTQR
ncbi:MAG: hypothetical protein A3D65_06810 [Candidatus Lloydbacteria bacterium RIFCSPHIGHO2_02_FULL_50_13]|uniref:Uncharacterized protein n=1 Tax=Candidatus Lloydbacteria bacterium RIFCSPHIGHO2_02_FULL_50_13 TaxID=1798661 RepID=A0A1G2D043_9BACT|nr:MAG: hypothetical protein A3D65_06810 [Candidatus Lloydbacteria bacterium RIFCSPHIGHO2_02_FULL_50_13]